MKGSKEGVLIRERSRPEMPNLFSKKKSSINKQEGNHYNKNCSLSVSRP